MDDKHYDLRLVRTERAVWLRIGLARAVDSGKASGARLLASEFSQVVIRGELRCLKP